METNPEELAATSAEAPVTTPQELTAAVAPPPAPNQKWLQQLELYAVSAQAILTALKGANLPIPGNLTDTLVKISSVIGAVTQGYHDPTSIDADLADIELALTEIEQLMPEGTRIPFVGGTIEDLAKTVTATRAGLANLAGGQFAVIGSGTVSIGGVEKKVIAGLLLEESALAKQLLGL